MIISDTSIKRPVLTIVGALIVILLGMLSFGRLPVREYPDTDVPTVSVTTIYRGASAEVVESRVTETLEEQLSAIDGIRVMKSSSREQVSTITIEFVLDRDPDEAANDVRDRVSRARGRLPDEVDEPIIAKEEADAQPVLWMTFTSDRFSRTELTDIVDRIAKQRIQTVPGVGTIFIGGERRYAMRLWLDPDKLASYQLTAADVEDALRAQNVDIPGGRIESFAREFTVRTQGELADAAAFEEMIIATRGNSQIKLKDVGRAELGSEDYRTRTFFNGKPTVGLGVVRQSKSNLLEVADGVKELIPVIKAELPEGTDVRVGYDSSVFVQRSVDEVFKTFFEAFLIVIAVIFFFLLDWRAVVIPVTAIPISIIGTFAVLAALGFSINILTLLALVLAIGLVVDDAIVMLENIYRRIEEGETKIQASVLGARQVAFAIIASTLTLAAVFLPVAFQSGSTGRLFYEFGVSLAVSVMVSMAVSLTVTPMLCSLLLKGYDPKTGHAPHGWIYRVTEPGFDFVTRWFGKSLRLSLRAWPLVILLSAAFVALAPFAYKGLQRELTPLEDRGSFISIFNGPLGSHPDYTFNYVKKMTEIIARHPELERYFSATAFARGAPGAGNQGLVFSTLKPWEKRERSTQDIVNEINAAYGQEVTGGLSFAIIPNPLGGRRLSESFELVLQGNDFDKLLGYGDTVLTKMRGSGIFEGARAEPKTDKPQLDVTIERERAADLGVPVSRIATTLESLFGGRQVTQYKQAGRQYDVILQIEDAARLSPSDLGKVYVRSDKGGLVQLSNVVSREETITPEEYPHFNRLRSISIKARLAQGKTVGDGVDFIEEILPDILPEGYGHAWDGETREYVDSASDTLTLFVLGLLFTFLILAAQFESWVHPVTIFTGVALALTGGVLTLYGTRFFGEPMTNNLFAQFGLILLIGLIAKNGILIVEFANQLQLEGKDAFDAVWEATTLRFRPILMTSISTIGGTLPLAIASGAGSETRNPLGLVVVGGMTIATVLTLFVVPVFYLTFDWMVRKVTGHSSAQGLRRAARVEAEVEKAG
ncbi:MAG: efflux RND transporter permease subunit [Verrucomicrobiaceae bacterium]|nr:MAG: efflux RND transporter permease subunit [Verrucomicrobiaceae bacterium]